MYHRDRIEAAFARAATPGRGRTIAKWMPMADECKLRRANGTPEVDCDQEECIYWRVAGHLGLAESPGGCAIQYFELLDEGPEMVAWLLSVKQRVDERLS